MNALLNKYYVYTKYKDEQTKIVVVVDRSVAVDLDFSTLLKEDVKRF